MGHGAVLDPGRHSTPGQRGRRCQPVPGSPSYRVHAPHHQRGRYQDAADQLTPHITAIAHHRAAAGQRRIAAAAPAAFAEYDIFRGLSGIGALLLATDPTGSALGHVLEYLVELTEPLCIGDLVVPGWWVGHDPRMTVGTGTFAAGHANLGAAHGIAGPLALLALAAHRGAVIDGQLEAIDTISAFLLRWRQESPAGSWWPETITADELAAGKPAHIGPFRPSWCYGTPGIARAGQLAAIATGDTSGQDQFEQCSRPMPERPGTARPDQRRRALPRRRRHLPDQPGAPPPMPEAPNLRHHLAGLANDLRRLSVDEHEPGLVNGRAGTALALQTAASQPSPGRRVGHVPADRLDAEVETMEAAVCAVLGGEPADDAALAAGLDPFELAEAVASYRLAGRVALQHAVTDTWQHLYIEFTDWSQAENVFTEHVLPALLLAPAPQNNCPPGGSCANTPAGGSGFSPHPAPSCPRH